MGSEHARQLLDACFEVAIEGIYSQHLLDEIEDVCTRDKFRKWFSVEESKALVLALEMSGTQVADRPAEYLPLVCEDADDNYLFALAEDADSNFIVTGDKKVLKTIVSWATPISLKQSLDLLGDEHEWGTYLIGEEWERVWEIIRAAGNE